MLISEIFASVQGEGQRAGLPTVFVRFARCPYRCTWCDSEHTFTGGKTMDVDEVVGQIHALGSAQNVCITGGEPLVQRRAVEQLCDRLLAGPNGPSVEIETSGGLPIWPAADPRLHWDLDVKCPGSGMEKHLVLENLQHLRSGDEIKFVLVDRRDFEYARTFILERLPQTPAGIFLQPAWGKLDAAELVSWLKQESMPHVRLSLQLHKYIWDPETLGV